MLENINKQRNYNKVICYDYKGIQVPVNILDIKIIKDAKEITLLELFNSFMDEHEKLQNEINVVKKEIKQMKEQVANALEYLEKEINKKGTI